MKQIAHIARRVAAARSPIALASVLLALCLGGASRAQGIRALPVVDEFATMEDRLGATADLDASFTDAAGVEAPFRDALRGGRPIVLNLAYFTCPGMCNVGLDSVVRSLEQSDLVLGRDCDVVTVSIDHRESPTLAAERERKYVEAVGESAVGHWRFLIGAEDQIRRLASSVGWRFRWSEHTSQYDHPPTLVLLSAAGTVTRYLDYRALEPATLRRAVIEAGAGTVGSFLEQIYVSCLTFDAATGVYSLTAMTIMRIGGIVTVLALATMLFVMWRRERLRPAAQPS